jgi:4-nitrophenyl phosphatase
MSSFDTSKIRGLILDMDGVIWRGNDPIGDLPTIFSVIEQKRLKVILASNNATRSAQQFIDKLRAFGVDLEPWQVVNSAVATASYLRGKYPHGGPVYFIGQDGLRHELTSAGFYLDDKQPLAVISSMDREINYEKLRIATLLIRQGIPFISTNPDTTFPDPEGLVPGAGSIMAALQAATDVQPVIIGKPQPELYRVALNRLGIAPDEGLMVGDRLETDIAGGQNIGCPTALVLTGVTSLEAAQEWTPAPDVIVDDLESLLALF